MAHAMKLVGVLPDEGYRNYNSTNNAKPMRSSPKISSRMFAAVRSNPFSAATRLPRACSFRNDAIPEIDGLFS